MPLAIVRRIGALSLALCACALPAVATAGADTPPAIRYALAAWSTEQSGDVFAIAQDLEGYLWLGTPDGPVRFDGTRFQPWARSEQQRAAGPPVAALAASSQGGVWVAFAAAEAWLGSIVAASRAIPPPTVHRPASTRSSRIVAARCGQRPVTGCSATPATAGRA